MFLFNFPKFTKKIDMTSSKLRSQIAGQYSSMHFGQSLEPYLPIWEPTAACGYRNLNSLYLNTIGNLAQLRQPHFNCSAATLGFDDHTDSADHSTFPSSQRDLLESTTLKSQSCFPINDTWKRTEKTSIYSHELFLFLHLFVVRLVL